MRKTICITLALAAMAAAQRSAHAQEGREVRARHEAELRGRQPAPKIGDPAPMVSAKAKSDGAVVDLSKPKRVTVLVFGSHT